jgi:hypothetical protein
MPASRPEGQFSARSPMKVSATARASAAASFDCTARKKLTGATRKLLPLEVSSSLAKRS